MPHNPLHPTLELLVPWDLPIASGLESDRQPRAALLQLLQALETDDMEQALQWVSQAIATLDPIATIPAQVETTKLSLKYWEIEDFDTFFKVDHVQTNQPISAVVKGLLLASYVFLQTIHLPLPANDIYINQQRLGFAAYAQLLLRILDAIGLDQPMEDTL
jgi:hypothetical protein